MFSQQERGDICHRLVVAARTDDRITAAAVVGSAALDRMDEWSDIDLALRLAAGLEPADVASAWTGRMYEDHGAVDHLDMWSGSTLFRVFLLSSSLQVDLSFWASDTFAPAGESFRLLFGEANEPTVVPPALPGALIGMGWLFAVHARSSIARGRNLQALYMVNGVRDHVVSLACQRYGLPAHQGRGVDALPAEVREKLAATVVRGLERSELSRAFAHAITALLDEAERIDSDLASRLSEPARELVRTAAGPPEKHREDAGQ
ncbi:MAG: nucleotidyltransferase domain-containing protein [Solirubrobacteraceae bacterium]